MGFKRSILDSVITMGYKFNQQVSIAFPPSYYHCELELLALVWCDVMVVINLDDFKACLWACEQQIVLFQCVMPMIWINGNYPTLRYITLCHYSKRWLLVSILHIQIGRLCIFITNNINNIECKCWTYYF
jgi:hypothetical protein